MEKEEGFPRLWNSASKGIREEWKFGGMGRGGGGH